MTTYLRKRATALAIALTAGLLPSSWGQAPLSEQQIKAGFVLNFARYVEWPEQAFAGKEAPLILCVLGRDPFGGALSAIERRSVQGRELRVRRDVLAEDTRGCHVLFVSDSEARRLAPILRQVAGNPILTVSDIEGFTDAGGGIGMTHGDERLQFEVNLDALQQGRLKASSQLLKLARSVLGGKGRN